MAGYFLAMLVVLLLVLLTSSAAQQCVDDNPNCSNWSNNGFCTNSQYASIRTTCRRSCGLCTPCEDRNVTDCINWVVNRFCISSIYTEAEKRQYCAASCGYCTP